MPYKEPKVIQYIVVIDNHCIVIATKKNIRIKLLPLGVSYIHCKLIVSVDPAMSGKPKYDQLIELLDTLVDWQKFGAFLPGIEREDIEVIEHESSSVDQQKAALFAKWLRLHPEASWDDVLSALAKSREYTLASNVYQNLNEVTTSRIDVQLQGIIDLRLLCFGERRHPNYSTISYHTFCR